MDLETSEDDFEIILVMGFMRSIVLLENFVLHYVDPSTLVTESAHHFLNRVKERKITGKNPIEVYLKPGVES